MKIDDLVKRFDKLDKFIGRYDLGNKLIKFDKIMIIRQRNILISSLFCIIYGKPNVNVIVLLSGNHPCLEVDVFFQGNEFGEAVPSVASWKDCLIECKNTGGCNFWSWNSPVFECHLLNSVSSKTNGPGIFSGPVRCSLDKSYNFFHSIEFLF